MLIPPQRTDAMKQPFFIELQSRWKTLTIIFSIMLVDFLFQFFDPSAFRWLSHTIYGYLPHQISFNGYLLNKLLRLILSIAVTSFALRSFFSNSSSTLPIIALSMGILWVVDMLISYGNIPSLVFLHPILNPLLYGNLPGLMIIALYFAFSEKS